MTSEWKYEYSELLTKKLKKLKKRGPHQLEIILKKRDDVKAKIAMNPDHFKNLSNELSEFKRVHIDKHFVLTFKVDKQSKTVHFEDYDHHDNIYD
ncbi:MAG TPA: addiction module toxin RelE [Candidatus Nanoarchaeia archaeon]|nr:addiction module toxin RelE [Candidatus Nanoarchaeia archaeon]